MLVYCPEGFKVKDGKCVKADGIRRSVAAGQVLGAVAAGTLFTARKVGRAMKDVKEVKEERAPKNPRERPARADHDFAENCSYKYAEGTVAGASCPEGYKVKEGQCVKATQKRTALAAGVLAGVGLAAGVHSLTRPSREKESARNKAIARQLVK